MAFSNYGEFKNKLSTYAFHTRFVTEYDDMVQQFEAAANRRLRVLPMETSTTLTTISGSVALPADYLAWRSVQWTGTSPYVELNYVHPAYLQTTQAPTGGPPQVFTMEGSRFHALPADDTLNVYTMHYYGKINTITGNNNNANWLLLNNPDCYLAGVLTELHILARNRDEAELQKARRDEIFAEIIKLHSLTTGATSMKVRESEFY